MQFKIQSIIFPEEKHLNCKELFYRGDNGTIDYKNNSLTIQKSRRIDLVTYINACSYRKWKTYTNCGHATIKLHVSGDIKITFLGYSKDLYNITKTVFDEKEYKGSKQHTIEYEYPDNDCQMIGVEITALTDFTIYGGEYDLAVDAKDMQNVNLSLATTTHKKEDFIKKNVELIKKYIINSDDEIAKNFTLHVVDNGRSLTEKDVNGKNIFLHKNINSGGSGGFARGMYESIHQKKQATHVLLMDDDVTILPESIKRTYCLLRLLKEEYRKAFISGAMLFYEDPIHQHEDIGTIINTGRGCSFKPLKKELNHEKIEDNLENERIVEKSDNSYAAWWYCCIPMSVIKENGLPLPLFIRGDDCEYSLRCHADIITMNGICVWHMGFSAKYNATFDLYQKYRNWLIMQATSGAIQGIDIVNGMRNAFKVELLRFNYNAAELIIRALEDYLKGPEFIKTTDGEKNTNENFKLNDRLMPLDEITDGVYYDTNGLFEYTPPSLKERIIAKITWNGQRFYPKRLERDEVALVSFDEFFQLHGILRKNKLLAVNPHDMSGVYRVKDKARFKELSKRFKKALAEYERKKTTIAAQYANAKEELTSEAFWKKYLGI